MGQSRFKWIILGTNGDKELFEGTFDELINNWRWSEPIAIIRGELL